MGSTGFHHSTPISKHLCLYVRKRTFEHVRPAKIQIRLRIRAVWSESSLGLFWIAKDAKCLHADNGDWSESVAAQADLIFVGRIC